MSCVHEKMTIQSLDRKDPMLPPSPREQPERQHVDPPRRVVVPPHRGSASANRSIVEINHHRRLPVVLESGVTFRLHGATDHQPRHEIDGTHGGAHAPKPRFAASGNADLMAAQRFKRLDHA